MMAREAHMRTPAADEPTNSPIHAVGPDPEKIKADWEKEKGQQLTLIVNRAQQVQARTSGALKQHRVKVAHHDEAPAAQARPKLAKSFQQVVEKEKAAAVEQMRARLVQRQQEMNERIEEPNPRGNTTREWAEMKKRTGLARAGRVAAPQNEPSDGNTTSPQAVHQPFLKTTSDGQRDAAMDADRKHAMDTDVAPAGQRPSVGNDQDNARKRAELLEKFKEKARLVREKDRGGRER